jgi:hypothetical protein
VGEEALEVEEVEVMARLAVAAAVAVRVVASCGSRLET